MKYENNHKSRNKRRTIPGVEDFRKQGFIWQSSEKPTEVIPYERIGKDFIYIYCSDLKKHLTTSHYSEDSISSEEFVLNNRKVIL